MSERLAAVLVLWQRNVKGCTVACTGTYLHVVACCTCLTDMIDLPLRNVCLSVKARCERIQRGAATCRKCNDSRLGLPCL
jgi:hypothetical protein